MLVWSNDQLPDLLSESNNFWSPSRNSNAARLNKVSGEHEYLRLELDATGYLEATTLSRNSATSQRYSVSKQKSIDPDSKKTNSEPLDLCDSA